MKTKIIEDFDIAPEYLFKKSYVFSCQGNDSLLLCASSGGSIVVDRQLLDSIIKKQVSDDLVFKLIQRNIVDSKENKHTDLSCVRPEYFIIDTTQKCNLECIYCFRNHTSYSMSMDILEDSIDYILKFVKQNNITNITVQPWGGEPLLAVDHIRYIYNRLKNENIEYAIDIVTNGTLVTPNIAEELKTMKAQVSISIDGNEVLHNRQRKYSNGNESYTDVAKGIKLLQHAYGIGQIGTICIITKHNYLKVSDILKTMIYDLEVGSVKFNFVRDNPLAKETDLSLNENEIEIFVKKLFEETIAYWRMGKGIHISDITIRLKNLLVSEGKNICKSKGCMGGKRIISIDRNGNIFPCEMIDFEGENIGNILNEDDLIDQINNAIEHHSFFNDRQNEDCINCPWAVFCRGGCTSSVRFISNEDSIDISECALNKIMYPSIIELLLTEPDIALSMIW